MRISELAEATGVSIPTLKYYLREGLLHAGVAQGVTRASYDESHVERVRLVRTLVDVGRLSIDRVREVVHALDEPPASRHELLGAAHEALRPHVTPGAAGDVTPESLERVRALGPPGCEHSPAGLQLAQALTAAAAGGWSVDDATLDTWHRAMLSVAETDVAPALATAPPEEAMRYAIVGTVLTDPVLLALRRVGQESVSARRLGGPGTTATPSASTAH
ncbi:hypothetical protein ASE25_07510 [Terrabacter sp. Root85]|uniref:MerR family transcriptional regulator n=1 Tax=Terrabacter sp. Root85 TaxID=1736603 RepID=UPI0006FA1FE9|nr:MerR family transcriptional regulator [Terrabacter sp. Root85]KRC89444.1 hypothetical protein ASE25_07510 [Terrabacter sp. Root85]